MQKKSKETTLLKDYVSSLRIGEPKTYKNLSVFPIFSEHCRENGFALLDEAVKTDRFSVTEINEGGSVPELIVSNLLDTDVLIIDGEELVGAKQNRIVNTSIIIGKGQKVVIPVSCVEQNRWQYRSNKFSSSRSHLYSKLRHLKSKAVHASLKRNASYRSDQREIWDDISSKCASFSVNSVTSAMNDIFESCDSEISRYEEQFRPEQGQIGFITMIEDKIAGADIFSSRSVLNKIYGKLLRGYIIDALEQDMMIRAGKKSGDKAGDGKTVGDEAAGFLKKINSAPKEAYKSIGEGQELRFGFRQVNGFALLNKDDVVHLAAFCE